MILISPLKSFSRKCRCVVQVVEEPQENSEHEHTILHTYVHISEVIHFFLLTVQKFISSYLYLQQVYVLVVYFVFSVNS